MSGKPASTSFKPPDRADEGPVAAFFFLFTAAYVCLYLYMEVPGLIVESRGRLLFHRLLLPEVSAGNWFGFPPSFALLDRWPVLTTAVAILVTGWLAGRLLLEAVGLGSRAAVAEKWPQTVPPLASWERIVFSCGVGLNAISLYVLAAGLAGMLNRWVFILPAAALAALSIWRAPPRWSAGTGGAQADRRDDEISTRWLWMAAPFVAAILLGAMLPPVDFDVREYHLQAPKEFFQQGSIRFLPHNVYGNMPLGSEMFSLLGMVLVDDWWLGALIGKTVIAFFAPLTALALLAAGRRFASPGAGVVAAVLYLSIPWVSVVSTSGLIEGALAFYLLLSLYAALLWWRVQDAENDQSDADRQGRWKVTDGCLALAGFCAGGAVSCKYPAVLFVAVPLAALVVARSARWGPARRGRVGRPAIIYSLALFAGCGLWFIKNWALTGNPVYPLLYDWFGGETRTPEINARWLDAHRPHQFGLSPLIESVVIVAVKSAWLSPVLVPLAALGLFVRRYRWPALLLAGYFGYVIATWWLFTHRIDRFWIPVLPVLALLAGIGAVWSTSLAWRRATLATLAVGLGVSFVFVTSHEVTYNSYFVSLARTRNDPGRVNGWHRVLNSSVPAGCRVLSVGDAQVFDIEVPVIYNTVFDASAVASICEDRPADQIASELRRQNISHVFVDWREIRRYRQPGNYGGIPDFVTKEFFQALVQKRVLDVPWEIFLLPEQEVYPVIEVCAAARSHGSNRDE
ncbi:MAG TPA: hypothetical protein VG826_15770 [Pirellulales bacterium]|nr:hypothetical protein [Pirellulales bacterium]